METDSEPQRQQVNQIASQQTNNNRKTKMHYEQRAIDLLTAIATKTLVVNREAYVTFDNKKGWNIAVRPDENNAKVDRDNIKESITAIVDRLAPKPELV